MFTVQNATRSYIRQAWWSVKKMEHAIKEGDVQVIASNAAEALRQVDCAVVMLAVSGGHINAPLKYNELFIINGIVYATAGIAVEEGIKNAKSELIRMMRATKYLSE